MTERAQLASLFVASLCVLGVEVAEVRVFSYSLDPLLVFCAISVALLGLGAGAIAVALRPGWTDRPAGRLAGSLSAFASTSLLAHAVFARASDRIGFGTQSGLLAAALPVLSLLAVPYFFAGVFIAIAMARDAGEAGKVYAVNLAGSAVGGVALLPLLRPFGVEPLLAAFSALAAWSAVFVAPRRLRTAAAFVAIACTLAVPLAPRLLPFQPDPGDLYAVAREALVHRNKGHGDDGLPRRELSRWDPVARIEVFAFPGELGLVNGRAPVRFFAQDGGAGSMLVDLRGAPDVARQLFEATVYAGAYALRPAPERALVIGVGGAPDVLAALHHGARHVTGVEINATTIDVVAGPYADMLGRPYADPRVRIVHDDGRSFVERTAERWDVIQMTGADTYAAGAAGAFMFSESYLYTVEAFRRYWRALADDGVLGVIRFGLEPYRVLATALAALRELGVPRPERHLVVVSQGIWVNVLVSKPELDRAALARVAQLVDAARHERVDIPVYDALGFGLAKPIEPLVLPGAALPNPYSALVAAAAAGKPEPLTIADLDFTPVRDDRPFFFQFLSPRQLGRVMSAGARDYYTRGLRAHLLFLLAVAAAAAALLLAPVALRERPRGLGRPFAFVAAIGLGYLFVEMTLMQKTALFVGHPTYAVSGTLVALLCGSGLGSFWSGRRPDPARWASRGAIAVAALLLVLLAALEPLFTLGLPWPFAARLAVLALVVVPLGFAMGVPFPSALRHLGASRGAVAWALAANSLTSVVASLLAVPLAMFLGFRVVLATAAALYAAAFALLRVDGPGTG